MNTKITVRCIDYSTEEEGMQLSPKDLIMSYYASKRYRDIQQQYF